MGNYYWILVLVRGFLRKTKIIFHLLVLEKLEPGEQGKKFRSENCTAFHAEVSRKMKIKIISTNVKI